VASLCCWCGTTPTRGDLITDLTVNVSQATGGLYTYSYTLTDESTSTLGASQLFLAVSPNANLSSVSAPSGWDLFYTAGDPDVSFLSRDSSFDIAPGTSGLFAMTSVVGPAAGADLIRGFDDNAGTFAQNTGTVLTASAPEPSSLVLGVLGAAGAAVYCRARRRHSARGGFVSRHH
jgi:hypothetical protein